jgi:hypothetical protein
MVSGSVSSPSRGSSHLSVALLSLLSGRRLGDNGSRLIAL